MSMTEKEQAEKIKALRKELEEKLEEQLPISEEGAPKVEVEKIDVHEELPAERAKQVIEALLFAATKPLTPQEIRKVLKFMSVPEILKVIREIQDEVAASGRSYELIELANGFEYATKKEFAPWIMKVELQKKAKQVTQSALETLSILVYKQPITRAEIEELRGVDVSGVMTTLVERDLVKIVGRKEVPGRPFMYGTTEKFLEHFGLKSLRDLPNIDEIKSIVESSVNKEDLLGKTNIVEVPAEMQAEQAVEATQEGGEETASEEVIQEDESKVESRE